MTTTKHVAVRRRLAAPAVIVAASAIGLVGCSHHSGVHIPTGANGGPSTTTFRVLTNSPVTVGIDPSPGTRVCNAC
jgi:hypothetical protein